MEWIKFWKRKEIDMAAKVHTYKLPEGQVTFAMMNKSVADRYMEMLERVEKRADLKEFFYSMGKIVSGDDVTVLVYKINPNTDECEIVEREETKKYKANLAIRKMMAKYNLLD